MLTTNLIPLLFLSVPLASATSYFNITSSQYRTSSVPPYKATLGTAVYDPATNTSTSCTISGTANKALPGNWVKCNDPTFFIKLDAFESDAWTLQVKHQYRGKNKRCVKSNGPQCKTSRAFVSFNSTTTPGYQIGAGVNAFHDPVLAEVFSSCEGGCGISSGGY